VQSWGRPLALPSPLNPASSQRTAKGQSTGRTQASRERVGRGDQNSNPVYLDLAYVPHHGDSNYSGQNLNLF